jgi:hypothetical protein
LSDEKVDTFNILSSERGMPAARKGIKNVVLGEM